MTKVPDNVVFYDGVCNLCDSMVQFLIKRDKQNAFCYAQIGGEAYQILVKSHPQIKSIDSIIFHHNNKVYSRSSGALKILIGLSGIWKLLWVFFLIPKPLRDFIYDKLAANRYRIFGTKNSCALPIKENSKYFIK